MTGLRPGEGAITVYISSAEEKSVPYEPLVNVDYDSNVNKRCNLKKHSVAFFLRGLLHGLLGYCASYRDTHKYINKSEKAAKQGLYDILAFKLVTSKFLN
jgi:hypothetical protein